MALYENILKTNLFNFYYTTSMNQDKILKYITELEKLGITGATICRWWNVSTTTLRNIKKGVLSERKATQIREALDKKIDELQAFHIEASKK